MGLETSEGASAAQTKLLTIDITADPICGFSYAACTQLERALQSYSQTHPIQVTTRIHPYIFDPNLPEDRIVARMDCLQRDFGDAGLALWETCRAAGRDCDLCFPTADYVGQTIDAQRLLLLALRTMGSTAQYRLLHILFYQHLILWHEITNPAFLAKIACCPLIKKDGILQGLFETEGAALDWLHSTELRMEILTAGKLARERGVKGIPLIVLNGRVAICGAQGEEAFRKAIERIL